MSELCVDGRRTHWVKRRLQQQWDLLISAGAMCANLTYCSDEELRLVAGWCRRNLHKRKSGEWRQQYDA